MAGIEYYLKFTAGNVIDMPDVDVMGLKGTFIRVPCIGCAYVGIVDDESGHKVKVVASRYTNDNPLIPLAQWHDLRGDEAILGWRTDKCDRAPGMWVVYLLTDIQGKLIIIPRRTKPTMRLIAANG